MYSMNYILFHFIKDLSNYVLFDLFNPIIALLKHYKETK